MVKLKKQRRMNEIQIFKNDEFGEVRTVMVSSEPWFVGNDVAIALGYSQTAKAVREHVDTDDKGVSVLDTPGGKQQVTIINESGLYSLILSSKLPSAKKLKRWVTSEVLPSIRKTGSYSVNVPQSFAEALRLAADQQEKIEAQQKLLTEQKPKVEFFDAVAESKSAVSMNEVAKCLAVPGMGRNNLFKFLRGNKVLMDNNLPYQEYIDRGYFRVIEQKWTGKDGMPQISYKTLVYQKGLDFIRKTIESGGTNNGRAA